MAVAERWWFAAANSGTIEIEVDFAAGMKNGAESVIDCELFPAEADRTTANAGFDEQPAEAECCSPMDTETVDNCELPVPTNPPELHSSVLLHFFGWCSPQRKIRLLAFRLLFHSICSTASGLCSGLNYSTSGRAPGRPDFG